MRNIAVVGAGYVGLVTATCFAALGNRIVCIDNDKEKITILCAGTLPFFEPGLLELILRNQHNGRLAFCNDVATGIREADCIFIAVGTPMQSDGHADLSQIRAVAHAIAESLDHSAIIVNKSTVPVETGDLVSAIIREHRKHNIEVSVVSNPEFLREGSAIDDFMHPDRIVLGVADTRTAEFMKDLYEPLNANIILTDVRTAEMIKYTANAFLATKISFINEIANLCEQVGADVKDVVAGAGSDKRIGTAFMNPGLGFGGSCFPKDVSALVQIAERYGTGSIILPAILAVNRLQLDKIFRKIENVVGSLEGKRIGLLGLAFKPNTDDIRESPAIELARKVISSGGVIVAHDPVAIPNARQALSGAHFVDDCYEAANDAEVLVVATDWNEYKQMDFNLVRKVMRGNTIIDSRNIYDPQQVSESGLKYIGVGRKPIQDGMADKILREVAADSSVSSK